MKVVHFVAITPGRCGLYETTKDLVLAERKIGIDSQVVNVTLEKDGFVNKDKIGEIIEDGEIKSVLLESAKDADILANHSYIPKECNDWNIPFVSFLHGRPESSFILSWTSKLKLHHIFEAKRKDEHYKGFVTFWREHLFPLSLQFPVEKLYAISSPVNLDVYNPVIDNNELEKFKGEKGNPAIMVADIWREDITPYSVIMAAAKFIKEQCPTGKLYIFGMEKLKHGATIKLINDLNSAGVLGKVTGLIKGLQNIYKYMDIFITPHTIATRTVREALASGVPVIAGTGNRFANFTANPRDIDGFANKIAECWANYTKYVPDLRQQARLMAEKNFSFDRVGQEVLEIYNKVLHKKKIFIDLGGHVGETVQAFYKDVQDAKDWQIYSWEPLPSVLSKLKEVAKQYKNVEIVEAVASNKTEIVSLFAGDINEGDGSTILTGKQTGQLHYTKPLQVKSKDFVAWFKSIIWDDDYVVLKMNIEGGEYSLLPDIAEFGLPISKFYIQFHSDKFSSPQKEEYKKIETDFLNYCKNKELQVIITPKGTPNFGETYDEYLKHQASKATKGLGWLDNYEKLYVKTLKTLIERFKPKGKSVLCLGARRGAEVLMWRDCGYKAIGIDLNTAGASKDLVIQGDFHKLPYKDGSKDILYSNSLDHVFDMNKFLDEVKRVLRPNGLFFIFIASPEDVAQDKYASYRWKSSKDLLEIIKSKGFKIRVNGTFTGSAKKWFDEFFLLRKETNEK